MADAVFLERRGVPTVTVGDDKLIDAVGRATAKLHGLPDLAFARVPYPICTADDDSEILEKVELLLPQIEAGLMGTGAPIKSAPGPE